MNKESKTCERILKCQSHANGDTYIHTSIRSSRGNASLHRTQRPLLSAHCAAARTWWHLNFEAKVIETHIIYFPRIFSPLAVAHVTRSCSFERSWEKTWVRIRTWSTPAHKASIKKKRALKIALIKQSPELWLALKLKPRLERCLNLEKSLKTMFKMTKTSANNVVGPLSARDWCDVTISPVSSVS